MLKLNIGFNKKVGEANYGSRGATVHLEVELDSSLIGDADRLQERIKQLFVLAKTAVDEELAAAKPNGRCADGRDDETAGNEQGHAPKRRRDGTRRATANQVRALHALAERQGIELADKLQTLFGVRDPAELAITEASGLIDELQGALESGDGR